MRLVIDMQGAQTTSRFRGIGRYTLSLTQEMARQRGEHEVLLVLNGAYADTIEPIRAAFADLLPPDAIHVFEVAGSVGGHDPANDARRKVAEAMREAFIASLSADVIFIPSLFEEYGGEAVTSVHAWHQTIPTAVTLHDLIPLVHRDVYLQDPVMERWYFNKLDHLRRADLFLAVSSASGREVVHYLNAQDSAVVTVTNACEAKFRPVSLGDAQRAHLKNTYGIIKPYVLNVGGIDFRKNLDGLFRAFAQLPAKLRATHMLVVVGWEIAHQKSHFLNVARQAGLQEDELVFTGYASEDDLVLLYNACELFVFPSWHEGFGLPVLEAMACGKAVIAANSSSLPEVVGREDALFAPRDDAAMAEKMAEVLGHPEFRQELERHGLEQVKKFSWQESARRAWRALEALHQSSRRTLPTLPLPKRPRLAFVSPLPPEKTGIADYAAELLPELARHYDITVIVQQDMVEDVRAQANAPIRDVAWFRSHARQFDRVLYHFGNSTSHSHMFELLAEIPGMVVLHDFYLSGILAHLDGHSLVPHGLARALLTGHGWNAVWQRFQGDVWNGVVMHFPCNLAVLQQALGIIVHSEFSRQLARRFYGPEAASDWAVIPHLRQAIEIKPQSKTEARQRLGLNPAEYVVCSFGLLGPTKLNHRLLNAWLQSTLAQDSTCCLVFVGENNSGDYGQALLRTIAESPAKERIRITGWADTQTYRDWLAAADVAVQLRTLSRGETSGTVLDAMNHGLTVITNAHGSMAELPAEAVCLLPDDFTDAQLVNALVRLHQDSAYRMQLGARARAHIREHHNPRRCAEQYAHAIEATYAQTQQGLPGLIQSLPALSPPLPTSDYPRLAQTLAKNFPPRPRKRQLLLDISELVHTDLKTGIQRVTRALLTELALNPPEGWSVEPVFAVLDQPGYRYARRFMSRFLGIPDDWAEDAPVEAWPGDVFFGLDLQPQVVPTQQDTLQAWHRRGVKVCFVVHDLLPVTLPEVFPPGADVGHQTWLQTITRFDGALCVSRTVANELFAWLQAYGEQRERPFALHWFHHGADVENSAPSHGLPADASQTLTAFDARPTFLMVGTIEPRKGYLQTLHAFSQLWEKGVDVNLVIVGKEGWKPLPDDQRRDIPQTVHALRSHPELGQRLFWLEGISDEYLEQVYAHSTCLIAASYDEGFGLPLIEAAQHGLPLLVRDIPVFREVTADQAYFFPDSRAPEVIAQAVEDWIALYRAGNHPRSDAMPHQTWADSARQVRDALFGVKEPYKTWQPDGVLRFWGNDFRLYTEVGERRGKSVRTTGKSGYLVYGPYKPLSAGRYRIGFGGILHELGEYFKIEIRNGSGLCVITENVFDDLAPGGFFVTLDFSLLEDVTDIEFRVYVFSDTSMEVESIILAPWVDLDKKNQALSSWIDSEIEKLTPTPTGISTDEITIIQTSDPNRYKKLLEISSEINKYYCNKFSITYKDYYGIRYGFQPHHAAYNRVGILKDLVHHGFSGWVIYVDADTIIQNHDIDIKQLLLTMRANGKFLWLSQDSSEHDYYIFNDGVFAIDLSNSFSKIIVKIWDSIYSSFYNDADYLFASHWDGIINDQESLSRIIISLYRKLGKEFLHGIYYSQLQAHWKLGWEIDANSKLIFFSALRLDAGGISAEHELELRRAALIKRYSMMNKNAI